MKKKKLELNKKLLLSKETIVHLNEAQQSLLAGGATATNCPTYNAECPTPATACFICPPLSEKNCPTYNAECPTPATMCFICPPLSEKCA